MRILKQIPTLLVFAGFCMQAPGMAQTTDINVFINSEIHHVSNVWIDSARTRPDQNTIRYNITGAHSYGSMVTTMIRIPQVLTLREVIRQILLYYFMLEDDSTRNGEELFIYPYFVEQHQPPPIRVKYRSGKVHVDLREWNTVQRPKHPTPEERDIYNQIIEDFFTEIQDYNTLSDERFRKIAQQNNMRVERVRKIYEDVILWNLTR